MGACTWTMGACTEPAGIGQPARIDPAALSARITVMMMVRLMDMIPPWRLLVSGPLHGSVGTHGTSEHVE